MKSPSASSYSIDRGDVDVIQRLTLEVPFDESSEDPRRGALKRARKLTNVVGVHMKGGDMENNTAYVWYEVSGDDSAYSVKKIITRCRTSGDIGVLLNGVRQVSPMKKESTTENGETAMMQPCDSSSSVPPAAQPLEPSLSESATGS